MKKYVLVSIFLVLIAFIVSGSTIKMTRENPDFYLNMVNATVLVCDDFGWGSGVFIEDNVILTAAHVLRNADTFNIELVDGTILESRDFYIDAKEDVGFIFVGANELNIVKISLLPVNIGDTVYLVGTPYNKSFLFTMTKGIISHLDRNIPEWNWENLLQTDAEGGPGCSGGPLYDSNGNIIGMYVGQSGGGGKGITLYEGAKSILEAYERCKLERAE